MLQYIHDLSTIQLVVWFIAYGMFCSSVMLFVLELKFPREKDLLPAVALSMYITALAFVADAILGGEPGLSLLIAFSFSVFSIIHVFILGMRISDYKIAKIRLLIS